MLLLMVLLYPEALASPQPLLLSVKLSENKGTAVGIATIVLSVEMPLLPLLLTKKKMPPPTTSNSHGDNSNNESDFGTFSTTENLH